MTERQGAVEFVGVLAQLVVACPTQPLHLVLDDASGHTAKLTRAWRAEHPQVTLCCLPSSTGHRENPVERVWWRLKQQVTTNRLYGNVEKPAAAVETFFGDFTPEAALHLAA